jgi:hypothetical protein
MSEIRAIMANCKTIRQRLRNPPNAVPDPGINLRAVKPPPKPVEKEPEIQAPPVIDYSQFIPFRRNCLTFSFILNFTAKEFNMTPSSIRFRSRKAYFALPRQIAIWLTYKNKALTLKGMGRYLGLDHSSIFHGSQKVQKMMDRSRICREYILSLEERLLADFNRTSVPAISESLLDCKTKQKNGNSGQNAISEISSVDNSGRSNIFDSEKIPSEPEFVGQFPCLTGVGGSR